MRGNHQTKRLSVAFLLTGLLLTAPAGAQIEFTASPSKADMAESWMKAPTISIMTGFIYEPLKPYTIQQWMENLGDKFDAEQWVKDFKEVGAHHLVFYDKWIDGLVFHDTKTTNFKTKRDFVQGTGGRLPTPWPAAGPLLQCGQRRQPGIRRVVAAGQGRQADRLWCQLADPLPDAALAVPPEVHGTGK